ncbi:MAG: pilus assembly protein PilM [Lachnospiraceae bacterium]|nr:pilus assembly protein PilM [Lachnospiraceae bacterium]
MARGRVKKTQADTGIEVQTDRVIFALDIGTRSLIGMVGTVEENKVKIIAVEREEHPERAMVDGQIEDIEKVAALAGKIKKRLEDKLHCELKNVCVAAAGRALRTERAEFEMELPGTQIITDEIISRLEAGAISKAEEAFDAEQAEDAYHRFYLVGYSVCQYYLDQYMISSLKDHRGRKVKVDLIATFLPSEVVESLYTTMNKIGLEVASITLEPIAAINAAIPENLRLLNLVMVDIGAGTSDIAACTDGSVTGYTMATVAGDEITETIMKAYLVDFDTAENMKAQAELGKEVAFTDILGFERTVSHDEILECIRGTSELLSREIAQKVLEINGGPPSALFLAGGGSKLTGLKDKVTEALKMDANRVAIAGNNFKIHAWSDEYELNNPEYATPLGIVISSGLNMINDSCRVILNERPAKLFRSGSFTALNLLMMNGFNYQDILGRSGRNLIVTVNGRRKVFYGTAPQPAALFINRKEGKLSEIIHAGDTIDFIPAIAGESASACLGDIEGAAECLDITLNGAHASLKTPLKNGDVIFVKMPQPPKGKKEPEEKPEENREPEKKPEESREPEKGPAGKAEPENAQGPGNPGVPGRAAEPEAAAESAAGPGGPAERTAAEPAESVEEPTSEPAETVEKPMSEPAARPSLAASASVPVPSAPTPSAPASVPVPSAAASVPAQAPAASGPAPSPASQITFYLNGSPIRLPRKANGDPYYLMDMIQYSGIDLKNPKGRVNLSVNGAPGIFQQTLRAGDHVVIEEEV